MLKKKQTKEIIFITENTRPAGRGDKDNGKTFDYICDVISGVDVNSYNDAEFFGKYSGFKEVQ